MNAYEFAEMMIVHDGSQLWQHAEAIANMLRQQADRIAELEKEKENYKYDPNTGEPLIDGYPLYSGLPTPQTKPLSDDEIKELSELTSDPDPTQFVRAIEERHGIK